MHAPVSNPSAPRTVGSVLVVGDEVGVGLGLDAKKDSDKVFKEGGFTFLVDGGMFAATGTIKVDFTATTSGCGCSGGGCGFTVVDVRDPEEFREDHILGAINIPVASFASQSGVLDKEKKIIVYCNSGGRSYNAYRKLQKLGYKQIGQAIFADWKEAGLPVEKGANNSTVAK